MNPPLRDVVVLNDYASTTGGSTAVAIASAVELAQRGLRVTYLSCVGPVAPRLRGTANLEAICLEQHEIAHDPNRWRALGNGLRNGRAVAAVRKLLATKDPRTTIVHAHTWMKALSPYALHAVRELGFALVVTLHDFFIACPNGGFFQHPTGRLCDRRPLTFSCLRCQCDRRNYGHKLWRSARTFLQNHWLGIPRQVSHYVGVSAFSVGMLRSYLPAEIPVSIVANPIATVDEGLAPVGRNQGFVFVGRLAPEKGVRIFANAVRRTGLPATFIGDGEMLGVARQLCPDARFTGWLDAAGIRAELRRARALVFPSMWPETLGLVALEAAAAGVPAIVSSRCAATEYVRHGVTGLHFAQGSTEDLATAMRRLADRGDLAALMGRNAYGWYWANPWTEDRHASHLLEIYRSLLTPTAIERRSAA